jgi:stage II sporulation protein D
VQVLNKIVKRNLTFFTIFFILLIGVKMKKILYYALLMVSIVVILPLIIVKGCSAPYEQPQQKEPSAEKPKEAVKITVYDSTAKKSLTMDIEEYVKGVVAAEMPANFEPEALKAQAVAARTFTYGRLTGTFASSQGIHDGIEICTDPAHCQAWKSKESAMKQWGILFGNRNWSKISKAVQETNGIIVIYNDKIANTVFHANSGGMTENIENVWAGDPVPYLRSVESSGEEDNTAYKNIVIIKNKDFVASMKAAFTNMKFTYTTDVIKDIKIISRTESGRVNNIKVGNTTMKGTDFREILGLKSTNFTIEKSGTDSIKITAIGNGHGVGMSQWGANAMAKDGKTNEEILKYYYQGTETYLIEDLTGL